MEPFQILILLCAAVIIVILAILLSTVVVFVALAPILGIYFIPSIIAFYRDTEHRWWILGTNLIFGSTGIGWLSSLIWAILDKKENVEVQVTKVE